MGPLRAGSLAVGRRPYRVHRYAPQICSTLMCLAIYNFSHMSLVVVTVEYTVCIQRSTGADSQAGACSPSSATS